MANVYEEGIYGTLLPDILIDKITLENSGFIMPEENPHIDNEREEIRNTLSVAPRSARNSNLSSVQGVGQTKDGMKVTLNFTIKEKYKNDIVGKWVSEIDFQKYLKIKVFEIRDARLSSLLSLSKDFAGVLDPRTYTSSKPAARNALRGYIKLSRDETLNFIKRNVSVQDISIQEAVRETSLETLDDGTKILNTHFIKTFLKPSSNVGHLSYYVASYLDYYRLIEDFEIKNDPRLFLFLYNANKISGEIVFDNFQVKGETYVYLDQNSKIWNGDVHKNEEGQYRSEIFEKPESIPLTRRIVSNSTVQDFRRRQQIEKVNFDFNPVKKYFENFEQKNSSTNTNFISKKNSYFGKIDIAIDEDKDAKIKFSIALKNLLFNSSDYAYLISDHDSILANRVARRTKIKSLKMFRQRVKIANSNNNTATIAKTYVPFSKNEIKQVLFHSKDPATTAVDSDKFYLRTMRTLLYPAVLEYTGVDRTASELSDGLYRYSLEIEVEDPFVEYFEEMIKGLQVAREELQSYKVESEKLSLSKYFLETSDPHINSPKEKDIIGTIFEGNYNILTNSFTETFIRKMAEKYNSITTAPWVLYTSYYADTLAIFVPGLNKSELQKQLQKFSSPRTGSPEGIGMVIKLIDHLISNISRILGKKSVVDNLSNRTSSSRSPRTFVVSHDFNNDVFDSNLENEVLVDYIDTGDIKESKAGLRSIPVDKYKERVEKEIEKYFATEKPNVTRTSGQLPGPQTDVRKNIFSYLSPTRFISNKETIVIQPTKDRKEQTKINNVISLAKTPNKTFYKKSLGEENLDLSIFNLEMQQKFSVTITGFKLDIPKEDKIEEAIEKEQIEEIEEGKTGKTSPESSREITDLRGLPPTDQAGIRDFISVFGPKANEKTTIFDIEMTKSDIQTRLSDQEKNRLPAQVTSGLFGDIAKDSKEGIVPPKTLKDLNNSTNQTIANVGSLKNIEILAGYEKGENNEILIEQPKWESITEEVISNIPNGKEITCRLADFSNKQIDIEDISKSAKPTNTTFTIVGNASRQQDLQEETTYNTKVKGINIEVSKDTLNQATKTEVEQNTYPTALTKTTQVSSKTIEQVTKSKEVVDATKKVQDKKVTTSKSVPKVSSPVAKQQSKPKIVKGR